MRRFTALLLAALMLTVLFAGCGAAPTEAPAEPAEAKADSDAAYITDKGEMVIGMTLFAPMNYYDSENKLVGFETEFATAVCEKLGVTPKFVEINWDSKEVELNAKNIDCIWNGMTITDDRKANMEISTPYMENKQIMVVKAENLAKYESGELTGANVVAEQGSAGETVATTESIFADAKFTPVDSQAKALLDVASGTSDVAIIDYVMSIGSIGEGTDFADLVVVNAQDFAKEEYGVAFRKGSDIAEKANAAMAELYADGTVKAIADKYKLADLIILG